MNYNRIYEELIADRLANPPGEGEYVEWHHIVPRCLGGTDEPSNLVKLTPEDHFFAHLLLAKAIDIRPLWAAVMLMHEREFRYGTVSRLSRRKYGWARRRFSTLCQIAMKGERNPNHKTDLIELKRTSGESVSFTRLEWSKRGYRPRRSAWCDYWEN